MCTERATFDCGEYGVAPKRAVSAFAMVTSQRGQYASARAEEHLGVINAFCTPFNALQRQCRSASGVRDAAADAAAATVAAAAQAAGMLLSCIHLRCRHSHGL